MLALLGKDLKILRRSPVLLVLLVLYPIVVALLIGFSFDRGPEKPRIAFLNEIPKGSELSIGGRDLDLGVAREELERHVEPVIVTSRAEAIQKVRDGDALGALIIPKDTVAKLESTVTQPTVEVIVNEEDPLKAQFVDDTISSVLADANQRVSEALTETTIDYLNLVLTGGVVSILGSTFDVLGLEKTGEIVKQVQRSLPADSTDRRRLRRVIHFNTLAQKNFGLVNNTIETISQPIRVKKLVLKDSNLPLSTFAASIAIAVSLMLISVLVASGSLALERDQHTFGRLVRGPVGKSFLLVEKILLAVLCAMIVVALMMLAVSFFIPVEWARAPVWVSMLAVAGLSFAALGAAVGAFAREVAAASLFAFTLLLPVAFLALIPDGVVGPFLQDVARVVSALFPFEATVDGMGAALYGGQSLLGPLAHLTGLAIGYAFLARLALRRFA